jgi:hypothetical protein
MEIQTRKRNREITREKMKTGRRKKHVNGDEKEEKTTKTEKTMRITTNTVTAQTKKGNKRGKRKRVEKRQQNGEYDNENKYSKN